MDRRCGKGTTGIGLIDARSLHFDIFEKSKLSEYKDSKKQKKKRGVQLQAGDIVHKLGICCESIRTVL